MKRHNIRNMKNLTNVDFGRRNARFPEAEAPLREVRYYDPVMDIIAAVALIIVIGGALWLTLCIVGVL